MRDDDALCWCGVCVGGVCWCLEIQIRVVFKGLKGKRWVLKDVASLEGRLLEGLEKFSWWLTKHVAGVEDGVENGMEESLNYLDMLEGELS